MAQSGPVCEKARRYCRLYFPVSPGVPLGRSLDCWDVSNALSNVHVLARPSVHRVGVSLCLDWLRSGRNLSRTQRQFRPSRLDFHRNSGREHPADRTIEEIPEPLHSLTRNQRDRRNRSSGLGTRASNRQRLKQLWGQPLATPTLFAVVRTRWLPTIRPPTHQRTHRQRCCGG